MGKAKQHTKGIFLLEGNWWARDKAFATTKASFELLEEARIWRKNGMLYHNHLDSCSYFFDEIEKWLENKYQKHPILVLAFHGHPGTIYVGRKGNSYVTLDEIEEALTGRCRNRIIHFSSCSVFWAETVRIREFLENTDALVVSGYQEDVEWEEAAAMDLLYAANLQRFALRANNMQKMWKKMKKDYGSIIKKTGFRMMVKGMDLRGYEA